MAGDSFFSELRKRRVFRAAAVYVAVAWGLTEVIVTIVEQLFLPAWVATLSVNVFVAVRAAVGQPLGRHALVGYGLVVNPERRRGL